MKNLGQRATGVGTYTVVTLTGGEEVAVRNPEKKSESTGVHYIFELTDREARELSRLQKVATEEKIENWQLFWPPYEPYPSSDITPLLTAVRAFVEARLQVVELRRLAARLERLLPMKGEGQENS